jgi:hypothetical protein
MCISVSIWRRFVLELIAYKQAFGVLMLPNSVNLGHFYKFNQADQAADWGKAKYSEEAQHR